ncbi:KGGVGR-motif variant AAA ATPase [Chitinophaga sp. sic0106]|uniref:KGGVGR-motif variant AAA ATPase n=1 Tax=Chitinophaga sp. sic0106 TaxID=2854785 RepID=UPI001C439D35|nr:tetratricopeptide repeat protein [Chitinophaga sp. sic0106]MBV7532723.1 tetratricopeptide repeat protein [Chitinophaga sp. sic0106]
MKTITFYSYKGGVGRSLALANIANKLAEFGKKVCILDFDLEAPGLHIKFGESIEKKSEKGGIVDYIFEFITNFNVPESIIDYVTKVNILNDPHKQVDLITAGDTTNKTYWEKLSQLNWNKLFYEEDSLGVDFFYNLKAQIEKQLIPDFLLIDSRTGITDIAGITMSILADEVALFAANNKENLDGIGQVLSALLIPENRINNTPPKIKVVLSRIPFFSDPKDKPQENNIKNAAMRSLNKILESRHIDNYKVDKLFVIHSDSELEMQECFKINLTSKKLFNSTNVPITSDYIELFEALTIDTMQGEEATELDSLRKAVVHFEKALNTVEIVDKIRQLAEATKLYPNYHQAHYYLGICYFRLEQYEKALESFESTMRITSQFNDTITLYKATILSKQDSYDKAIAILKANLNKDSEQDSTYLLLGSFSSKIEKFDEAQMYYKLALEINPQNPEGWNAYANTLRLAGKYPEGFEAAYNALDLAPQHREATATLAELNASIGNLREFYKNFDLALSLGLTNDFLQTILEEDKLYRSFFDDERFLSILDKYKMKIDWEKIK